MTTGMLVTGLITVLAVCVFVAVLVVVVLVVLRRANEYATRGESPAAHPVERARSTEAATPGGAPRSADDDPPHNSCTATWTRRWRWAGLAAGLVGAGALTAAAGTEALGRFAMLAPAAAGAGLLLGVVGGELTAPRRLGPTRTATLARRTLGAVVPRAQWVRAGVGVALLGAVLLIGVLRGGPDDAGRPGRALTRACWGTSGDGSAYLTQSRGPWPGSFYAVPLGLAVVGILVLAIGALAAIVRRPRPSARDATSDDRLRGWAATNVVAATDAAVRTTAGPLALIEAMHLGASDTCRSAADLALALGLLLLGGYAVITGIAAVLPLLRAPGHGESDPATGAPTGGDETARP